MKRIFSLILIFFLVFSSGGQVFALDLDYLRKNSEDIFPDPTFDLLSEGIESKKIFMVGEAHGVGVNPGLAFDLLVYLQENAGVRYVLWEGGYALGRMLNYYVQGGSEEMLDLAFSQLEGTAFWSQEEYQLFKVLADFNTQLDPEERIEIVGIDLDLPLTASIIYLDYLLGEKDIEILDPLRELASTFRELKGEAQLYSSRVRLETFRMANYLQRIIGEKEDYLEGVLGENWFDFKFSVKSLIKTQKTWGEGSQAREDNSFSNFIDLSPILDRGGFFARWGANHVLQRTQAGVNWLGGILDGPDSPWQGQVLSIYFVYDHCQRMDPKTYRGVDYSSGEIRGLETLRRAAPGEKTLFWLDAPGSPFREEVYFLTRHSRGVTTDYFQYILMIRNKPAANPLAGSRD